MPTENRSVNPVRSSAIQAVLNFADFTGAGNAEPTVSASTVLGLKDNYAATRDGNATGVVHNGIGSNTYTFPTAPAAVLAIMATARGATDLEATVSSWAITAGRLVVTVKTWSPAGANTDLANGTDFLRLMIVSNLSNA